MPGLATLGLPFNVAIFAAAAFLVWWAGSRLPPVAAAIGARTGIGQAFAGMLLLGGITSLPELATASSAAAFGAPELALNNVIGSAGFNVLLLAVADAVFGRGALTAAIAKPATLLQGVLGMLLLGLTAALVITGDTAIGGVGAGSSLLLVLCVGAMWLASQYETRPTWIVVNPPTVETALEEESGAGSGKLGLRLLALGGLVLLGGILLAQAGDAIADRTGISAGIVGFIFLASATSLPELTAITAAIRGGHYELAVGDIFGANLFNVAMIFLIDVVAIGPPVLGSAGPFEAVAALVALLLTGTFVVGLLERADRSILRMGYDSVAALLVYSGGLAILLSLPG